MAKPDRELLTAALAGYQYQHDEISARVAAIRAELGGKAPARAASPTTPPTRRMSAAGRARIAAAQRARWAKFKKQAETPAKPTRRLSVAGRAAIVAATKKRWATVRRANAAAAKPAPAKKTV